MTILRIELDENVAAVVREQAELAGKTPETWAAEIVTQQTAVPAGKEWIEKFLQAARTSPANSQGWKWNREELYDR